MATTPDVRIDISYQTDADRTFVKRLYQGEATLTSKFNASVRQFYLTTKTTLSADADVIRNADTLPLQNNFDIDFGDIFSGKIITQFDMITAFGIAAAADKLKDGESVLSNTFNQPQTDTSTIAGVIKNLPGAFSIPKALPFGLFVETEPTTLSSRATTSINTDLFEGVFVNAVSRFNLTDGTEFIDGTNRKFTEAQLTAIGSNNFQVVDFVEIIINYEDVDLPLEEQVRIPPVLRWNSSGRDLEILDYKGNTQHYKGKNVMMRLPSFEYNGMFTKKTLKIQINGLLRFFNQAMILGYLNYAPVTMGKAIFNYNLGTVEQIDRAVLLQRGHVNSFTLSGSPDQQSTTIEVDSGFYDYDRRVATRTNSASYSDYLTRASDYYGITYNEPNTNDVGTRILDKIFWGADVVL